MTTTTATAADVDTRPEHGPEHCDEIIDEPVTGPDPEHCAENRPEHGVEPVAHPAGQPVDDVGEQETAARPTKRISTKRNPALNVKSHRVWLDQATRERIARLHHRISDGLNIDASLSVLMRLALADFEDRVNNAVPANHVERLRIPTDNRLSRLKLDLLVAAKGAI